MKTRKVKLKWTKEKVSFFYRLFYKSHFYVLSQQTLSLYEYLYIIYIYTYILPVVRSSYFVWPNCPPLSHFFGSATVPTQSGLRPYAPTTPGLPLLP
jgi:hypothetical protein